MEKDFKRLTRAFNKLLPFTGLWASIKLSYLNRWLSAQCPEVRTLKPNSEWSSHLNSPQELVQYLQRLYEQWSSIMEGYSAELVDPETVALLETLMPDCSLHDRAHIENMMEKGKLFPALNSASGRRDILNRVLQTRGRILSFYTFGQDFLYLEACISALRKLLPYNMKGTVSQELTACYSGVNQLPRTCRVQIREDVFQSHLNTTGLNSMLGYRQLFLAVMRDFPVLSNLKPYRDNRKTKPKTQGIEADCLFRLAWLGFQLGFETQQLREILDRAGQNADEAVARDFVQKARPPEWYVVDNDVANDIAGYVGSKLSSMTSQLASRGIPYFTTDLEMQPKRFRCSRPSFNQYESDRKFLFIDTMYNYRPIPRAHPTSLAVQRDIFVCYFGELELPSLSDGSTSESPRTPFDDSLTHQDQGEPGLGSASYIEQPTQIYTQDPPSFSHEYETRIEHTPSFMTTSISTVTSADEAREFSSNILSENLAGHHDTPMNEFHTIANSQPSLIIKELLSDESLIIIYDWDKKAYAKFSIDPQQKAIFELFVCNLADEMQQFITREDNRVYAPPLSTIWSSACRTRLVLVGLKQTRAEPGPTFRFLLDRDPDGFYGFMDWTAIVQED
jgi:hypothetical protein